jgi:hypothetical protein
MRAKDTVLLWLVAVVAIAGCGSDSGSSRPATVPGVAYAAADTVKAGMPRTDVNRRLGEPILTSRPTDSAPGGCVYYAMQGRPPADVWQFCFDQRNRVNAGATLYSVSQPAPPAGASAARAALLGRGDTICQVEIADLARPLKRLDRRLTELKRSPNRANRRRAARLIGRFDDVLKKTLSELNVFNPPPDQRSALADYLDALRAQTRVLPSARTALAASQDQRYSRLIRRFDALGNAAAAHARRYGFSTCSGATFS